MKPILALVVKMELNQVPALLKITLQCISAGVKSLCCVMMSSLNGSICDLILDQLAWEVDLLTHNPLLLSASMNFDSGQNGGKKSNKRDYKGSSSSGGVNQVLQSQSKGSLNRNSHTDEGIDNSNDDRAAMYCSDASRYKWLGILFDTSESILINCRHMLSSSVRERYADIIRRGLTSLSLGIVPSLFYDRHMQRQPCAPIRSDVIAQSLLLQLATAEVFIPNTKQQYSQNLSFLQKAAELCIYSTATAPAASRALMIISTLLQPTTVALPAIPFIEQAKDFILQSSQQRSKSNQNRDLSCSWDRGRGSIGESTVYADIDIDTEDKKQSKRQKTTVEVMALDRKEVVGMADGDNMALTEEKIEDGMNGPDDQETNRNRTMVNPDGNELPSLYIKMSNVHSNDSGGNQIVRDDQIPSKKFHDDFHPRYTGGIIAAAPSQVSEQLVQQKKHDDDDDNGDNDDNDVNDDVVVIDDDDDDDDDDSLPDIDIDADPDVI